MTLDETMLNQYATIMLPKVWEQMELLGYKSLAVRVFFDDEGENKDFTHIGICKGKYVLTVNDGVDFDELDESDFNKFDEFYNEPVDLYHLDATCREILEQCEDLEKEIAEKMVIVNKMEAYNKATRKVITEKA